MKGMNQVIKMLSLITQVGFTMLCSIGLCSLVGYFIDSRFHTHTFIIFIILGVVSGYRGVYILIKQTIKPSQEELEQQRVLKGQEELLNQLQAEEDGSDAE